VVEKTPYEEVSSATISIPDEDSTATLVNGKGTFIISGTASMGEVSLDNNTIEVNGKYYGTYGLSTGGSGYFMYLGPFEKKADGTLAHTDSAFLGDRIIIQNIKAEGDLVTVTYLDRAEDEPFSAEPSVKTEKVFKVNGSSLEEATIEENNI